MTTTYHVWNEHTLVYKTPHSMLYGVLAGILHKGGANWINGPVLPLDDELRDATLKDFESFRVCPKGHIE